MPAAEARPLLFRRVRLVDPALGCDAPGDLLVVEGRIAATGPTLGESVPEGARIIEGNGRVLAPGLVDMRVFVGEPGQEYRETLRTAGEAAAAGGVTSFCCMPDTDPPLDDTPSIDFIMRRARDRAVVRVHPMAAITQGLRGEVMTEIGLLREAGAIAFTDGARSVASALVMRRALSYARMFDALIVQHCEEPTLAGSGVMNEGAFAARLGLPAVPHAAETLMLERDMRLLALTGGRYHAALVSCTESLEVLRRAKGAGLAVTAGVSINTLTFNEHDIGPYRTFFKLSPPLRSEAQREALVAAVAEGLIDAIVSDHNPQDVETKRQPFAEAADGAVGLETMLSAGLRLVAAGAVSLLRLMDALSTRPARILGLPAGTLAVGAPADLVLFDPEEPWVCDRALLRGRARNTPFDGARMTGRVHMTMVGGRVVHEHRREEGDSPVASR